MDEQERKDLYAKIDADIKKYIRKPFLVDAVRVTEENMEEVAKWCRGRVSKTSRGDKYIKVEVENPLSDRQTKGFVGDWVLFAGRSYKVYTDKAFERNFDLASAQTEWTLR